MILALDLGNSFGYAIKQSATIYSGFDRLVNKAGSEPGKKFHLFDTWLNYDLPKGIKYVYFEDVKRHASLYNARAYCGYLAILQAWCVKNQIECRGVGVGTIKLFATGNGRASKKEMISAAKKYGFDTDSHDEADAIHLLRYVISSEGLGHK